MEQLKILNMIDRWGYLNTEQISLLLEKNIHTIKSSIDDIIPKKLLRVDQLTRKNIYMLSSLGNRKLGKESKSIRINYNELTHQDLLIKWVSSQNKRTFCHIKLKKNWNQKVIKGISWFANSLWK